MSVSVPLKAALRGRCGVCSQGKLFEGFLKLKSRCDHCGQDFTVADTALPHRGGPPVMLVRRFPRSGVHAATSSQ